LHFIIVITLMVIVETNVGLHFHERVDISTPFGSNSQLHVIED